MTPQRISTPRRSTPRRSAPPPPRDIVNNNNGPPVLLPLNEVFDYVEEWRRTTDDANMFSTYKVAVILACVYKGKRSVAIVFGRCKAQLLAVERNADMPAQSSILKQYCMNSGMKLEKKTKVKKVDTRKLVKADIQLVRMVYKELPRVMQEDPKEWDIDILVNRAIVRVKTADVIWPRIIPSAIFFIKRPDAQVWKDIREEKEGLMREFLVQMEMELGLEGKLTTYWDGMVSPDVVDGGVAWRQPNDFTNSTNMASDPPIVDGPPLEDCDVEDLWNLVVSSTRASDGKPMSWDQGDGANVETHASTSPDELSLGIPTVSEDDQKLAPVDATASQTPKEKMPTNPKRLEEEAFEPSIYGNRRIAEMVEVEQVEVEEEEYEEVEVVEEEEEYEEVEVEGEEEEYEEVEVEEYEYEEVEVEEYEEVEVEEYEYEEVEVVEEVEEVEVEVDEVEVDLDEVEEEVEETEL